MAEYGTWEQWLERTKANDMEFVIAVDSQPDSEWLEIHKAEVVRLIGRPPTDRRLSIDGITRIEADRKDA